MDSVLAKIAMRYSAKVSARVSKKAVPEGDEPAKPAVKPAKTMRENPRMKQLLAMDTQVLFNKIQTSRASGPKFVPTETTLSRMLSAEVETLALNLQNFEAAEMVNAFEKVIGACVSNWKEKSLVLAAGKSVFFVSAKAGEDLDKIKRRLAEYVMHLERMEEESEEEIEAPVKPSKKSKD
jgi:hypothetical protein